MKKKFLTMFLMLALLATLFSAVAECGARACLENGTLKITWDACSGSGVVTVYQNKWPVLLQQVDGAAGGCTITGCSGSAATYSVRVRFDGVCKLIGVENASKPTAAPTPKPVATATVRPTSTPVVTPTPAQNGSTSSEKAAQVIAQVNQERAQYGLGSLREDSELTRAACVRAQEIVQKFSHTRPDGSSWSTVSSAASGENIAKGYATVEKVMAAWMSSQGHRENILRESFTRIGVCAYTVDGVVYWVQLFGR
ncbi:MAG: CAP domain-containing protein [Eubacteriales bacterium]|nr:CAP domain-containing protein [Eubacteriales bacterium]